MLWLGVVLIAVSMGLMINALMHYDDVPNYDWATMERISNGRKWNQ